MSRSSARSVRQSRRVGRVDLATSYRAHREMVEALNALLHPVLGEFEDPDRPYVEPFSALAHHRDAPATGLRAPTSSFTLR